MLNRLLRSVLVAFLRLLVAGLLARLPACGVAVLQVPLSSGEAMDIMMMRLLRAIKCLRAIRQGPRPGAQRRAARGDGHEMGGPVGHQTKRRRFVFFSFFLIFFEGLLLCCFCFAFSFLFLFFLRSGGGSGSQNGKAEAAIWPCASGALWYLGSSPWRCCDVFPTFLQSCLIKGFVPSERMYPALG